MFFIAVRAHIFLDFFHQMDQCSIIFDNFQPSNVGSPVPLMVCLPIILLPPEQTKLQKKRIKLKNPTKINK